MRSQRPGFRDGRVSGLRRFVRSSQEGAEGLETIVESIDRAGTSRIVKFVPGARSTCSRGTEHRFSRAGICTNRAEGFLGMSTSNFGTGCPLNVGLDRTLKGFERSNGEGEVVWADLPGWGFAGRNRTCASAFDKTTVGNTARSITLRRRTLSIWPPCDGHELKAYSPYSTPVGG